MPNGNVGTFHRGRIRSMTDEKMRIQAEKEHKITPQCSVDDLILQYKRIIEETDEVWASEHYQVRIKKNKQHGFGDNINMWHLVINRVDLEPIHDWRDLQEIKNLLCGREVEAVELYPSESRLVDTRNHYHLWVLFGDGTDKIPMFPFGFSTRKVTYKALEGVKQRESKIKQTHNG